MSAKPLIQQGNFMQSTYLSLRNRTALTVVSFIVVMALGALTVMYLSGQSTKRRDQADLVRAQRLVSESTVSTGRLMDIELNDQSQTTFQEIFDRADSEDKRIDDAIVELKTMEVPHAWTNAAVEYLERLQNVNRAISIKYRKVLEDRQYNARAMSFAGQVDQATWRKIVDEGIDSATEKLEAAATLQKDLSELKRFELEQKELSGFRLVDPATISSAIQHSEERSSKELQ